MSANELVAREIEAMTERICRVREEYAGTERTSTPATRGARRRRKIKLRRQLGKPFSNNHTKGRKAFGLDNWGRNLSAVFALCVVFAAGWIAHGMEVGVAVARVVGNDVNVAEYTSSTNPTVTSIGTALDFQTLRGKLVHLASTALPDVSERVLFKASLAIPSRRGDSWGLLGDSFGREYTLQAIVQKSTIGVPAVLDDTAWLNPNPQTGDLLRSTPSTRVRPRPEFENALDGMTVLTPGNQTADEKRAANQRRLDFATAGGKKRFQ